MTRALWWATLRKDSPRYRTWRRILGADDVPLRHPGSAMAQLGDERVPVYELDIAKLDPTQHSRLCEWMVKFGMSKSEASVELFRNGFPIREADVLVAFDLRAFL